MSIYNPYRHAKRKNDQAKIEELKVRLNGIRERFSKDGAVFDHVLAKVYHSKGFSL